MHQAPPISRSSFGRTLGVAGWVLAAAALLEILFAAIGLMDRARHNPPLSIQVPPPEILADNSTPALPSPHPAPSFGDPFASLVSTTPAPAPLSANAAASVPPFLKAPSTPPPAATPAPLMQQFASLAKPTPVEETQVVMPQSRVDGLIAEAKALSQRGDMSTAITRLREALAMAPRNPLVISELAGAYEKMGLDDKALEQWRTIYDMGESAGIYYMAADAKLKAAELQQNGAAATPTPQDNASTADQNGFQPGSVLALTNLSTVEKPESPEGYKRFTLKIPIKRAADAKIDVTGVWIQVFFYDQLGDQSVVRTNARVASRWAALPADWQNEDTEVLEVDYNQAPPEPGKIEEGRHYYGYIVCVYYNKQLQDQTADPQSLIKAYPPPLTLQDEK